VIAVSVVPSELFQALRALELRTMRLANDVLVGQYASGFRGQGLAFREVRPYTSGDDVRAIDWNVSARMNEPFVKVFDEEREMTVLLGLDRSASLRFGTIGSRKDELQLEAAALLAISSVRGGDRIGLVLGRDRVEHVVRPRRGQKHALRVITDIVAGDAREVDQVPREALGAATDLKGILETSIRVARRRSLFFLLSDFLAEGWESAFSLASSKHDLVPVVLTDRRDGELPDVGLATFEDLESGEAIVVDTGDPDVRAAYSHSHRVLVERRRKLFSKLSLDAVTLETGRPVVAPFRDLFRKRTRRHR
jgi:uncharacterized protein (DUF58 family)